MKYMIPILNIIIAFNSASRKIQLSPISKITTWAIMKSRYIHHAWSQLGKHLQLLTWKKTNLITIDNPAV